MFSKYNQRLIARYLGVEPNNGGEYEMYSVIPTILDEPSSKHFYFPSEMLFDTDWNWLMTAVLKIEENGVKMEIISNESGSRVVRFGVTAHYSSDQSLQAQICDAIIAFIIFSDPLLKIKEG